MANWRRFFTVVAPGLFPPLNWDEFVGDCAANEVTSFVGGTFKRGPGGTSLAVNRASLLSAVGTTGFQLINATTSVTDDEGHTTYTKKIRIVLGTLQDTSEGGTPWIPTGMTAGDAPANWYIVDVAGSGFAWLVVTYDPTTGVVSSVTLDNGAAVPANASGTAYISLGTYDADTSPSSVLVTGAIGDQACQLCGTNLLPWPV